MQTSDVADRLKNTFPGCEVMVTDQTGSGNHFEVRISSGQFKGKTRIACHREVMAAFSEELKSGEVHALSIITTEKES